MKKVLLAVLLVGLAASASATTLLVEEYQEGQINVPYGGTDTIRVVELSFSVDTSCHVMFTGGGLLSLWKVWLEHNGETITPIVPMAFTVNPEWFNISYSYLLEPGEHTVSFVIATYGNTQHASTCTDTYLQTLIFLPDAGGAIAERPAGDVDADATGAMTSVISRGPYVSVTGATELVDATGRVIENAIVENRVSINNLSQGTYFARKEGKTLVKIVKVE